MTLVEQELLTLPEHLSSFTFQWGTCYSIFSFMCMFCKQLFVPFLLAIVLPVLRFTNSDYPFGIFKLFRSQLDEIRISIFYCIGSTIIMFNCDTSFNPQLQQLVHITLFACLMVLSATFNNISVTSLSSVLLVEKIGVPGENHRPVASHSHLYHIVLC